MKDYLEKVVSDIVPQTIVTLNKKGSAIFSDVMNEAPEIVDGIDICDMEVHKEKTGLKFTFYDANLVTSKKVLLFDDFVNTGETASMAANHLTALGAKVHIASIYASKPACARFGNITSWRTIDMELIPHMFMEWSMKHVWKLGLERFSKNTIIARAHFTPSNGCQFLLGLMRKKGISYDVNPNVVRQGVSNMIRVPLGNSLQELKIFCDDRRGTFDFWVHGDNIIEDSEFKSCQNSKVFCLKENGYEEGDLCPQCMQLHVFFKEAQDLFTIIRDSANLAGVQFFIENLMCPTLEHQLGKERWQALLKRVGY